ncbi:peptidase M14 [Acetobacter aceti 1023]|nr:peptidase M14 [Acetobacter aceti 1023]
MSCASKRHIRSESAFRFRAVSALLPPSPPPLPVVRIEYPPPDISPWITGNCGIEGVHHFESRRPGPHVAVTALMHGNEYAGAYALQQLLMQPLRPLHGRLSLIFLNLAAYKTFNPARPTLSRFIDEDMNRLWQPELIASTHTSVEMQRVREVLPVLETVDILLDIHTMLWPAQPLFLCSMAENSRDLACCVASAQPHSPAVIQDNGHQDGLRLIDYTRFNMPHAYTRACLLEAGQHWQKNAAQQALLSTRLFLAQTGTLPAPAMHPLPSETVRQAIVTDCVRALTSRFVFVQPFASGCVIRKAGTVIAFDGQDEIRTPYNNCILVMPNLRPRRGHTAVRLAKRLNSITGTQA